MVIGICTMKFYLEKKKVQIPFFNQDLVVLDLLFINKFRFAISYKIGPEIHFYV